MLARLRPSLEAARSIPSRSVGATRRTICSEHCPCFMRSALNSASTHWKKGPNTLCRSRPKFAPIQPLQEEKGKGQTVSGRSSISLQFAKFLSGSCCKMGQSRCRERRENKRPARAGAKYRANCRTGQKNNTHEAYAPSSPRRRRRFDTKSICPAAPRSSGIFVAIWLSRRCYVLSQTQNFVGGKQQKAPAKAWASPKRKTRWPKFGKQLQRKKDSGGLSAVAGVLVVLPTTAKA